VVLQKASDAANAVDANDSNVEEEEKGDAPWLLFNDFLVERTVLEDARGFKPSWKVCICTDHHCTLTSQLYPLQFSSVT
jgi:hypothetical protein